MPLYKPGRMTRPPTHPGAILREDALPALKLTVSQAARDLGVTRQFLHRLLNEDVPISAEMALKIGRLCGNGPELWINMQAAYDLWHAKQRLGPELDAVPERHKAA
ncbi:MAG: addiction module antidote protein, HigA family [Rhodospirillales bacterium]|nr:addiction module antidote protein, HigA family [Rhodospirillales bacterium]